MDAEATEDARLCLRYPTVSSLQIRLSVLG
jgi:hypothetical protein